MKLSHVQDVSCDPSVGYLGSKLENAIDTWPWLKTNSWALICWRWFSIFPMGNPLLKESIGNQGSVFFWGAGSLSKSKWPQDESSSTLYHQLTSHRESKQTNRTPHNTWYSRVRYRVFAGSIRVLSSATHDAYEALRFDTLISLAAGNLKTFSSSAR